MINTIKTQLWTLLKEKQVSLVMIFDKDGQILWHRGRKIKGNTIEGGEGFPKSFIKETIKDGVSMRKEDVGVELSGDSLSESAKVLHVKSMIILPINQPFFLYIDSGTKKFFQKEDHFVFKILGELLGKMIERIRHSEMDTGGITGESPKIKRIREIVLKYSLEEEPILLVGETGVGKTHISELIHQYSGRRGRFEVAGIANINENLFESVMFGHKKGSFTDAKSDKIGLVQAAQGGTLLIDEIAEIPVSFQIKLLRFIETKKYRILGEAFEREADVRIIAATNRNLPQAIKEREFREDLYYRLQVLEIEIPPLRKRKEDLKAFFMEKTRYLKGKEIGEGFFEALYKHNWPGNIRELFTVFKRLGILYDSPITGEDVESVIKKGIGHQLGEAQADKTEKIFEELKAGKNFWEIVKKPFLERELNRDQVKSIISRALKETNGRHIKLLEIFNIDKSQYYKFMKFLYRNNLR